MTKRRKPKPAPTELAPKRQRFVLEYLIDRNATQAAIRSGYSVRTAASQGQRLLTDPRVRAAIDTEIAAQSKRTKIDADRVLEEYWSIATANANEIVEFRRTCCRHCYGRGFNHQRTARELSIDRAMFALRKDPKPGEPFDEKGGDGYDARRDPNPSCPECFGEGVGAAFFKDTRKLAPDAARLYAGVRITRDGIELKTYDKLAALDRLAQHFGLLKKEKDDEGDVTEEDLERRLVSVLQTAAARKKATELGASS
jgi:phage terminase small subunit